MCDSITRRGESSNAGVLLRSAGGFDKAVYQEMLAAFRPLTLSPPLNTVLILPDGEKEIMRGIFERFDEVFEVGGIILLRVHVLIPGICVAQWLSRTPRPINNETTRHPGSVTLCVRVCMWQQCHCVRRPCAG